jgi:hypothetical protein
MQMPRTKVPLTLTLHKLMAPRAGIGGVLQLPVRVAGLPINAAARGSHACCVCCVGVCECLGWPALTGRA